MEFIKEVPPPVYVKNTVVYMVPFYIRAIDFEASVIANNHTYETE